MIIKCDRLRLIQIMIQARLIRVPEALRDVCSS